MKKSGRGRGEDRNTVGRVSGKEMGQPWCHRGLRARESVREISRCAEDVEGNGARDGRKEGAEFRST